MHDRVHKIIRDHLGPSKPLSAETRFADDLGADSLDMLELSMAFEDEFGIAIPDDDLDGITTVGKAVEYIDRRTA